MGPRDRQGRLQGALGRQGPLQGALGLQGARVHGQGRLQGLRVRVLPFSRALKGAAQCTLE